MRHPFIVCSTTVAMLLVAVSMTRADSLVVFQDGTLTPTEAGGDGETVYSGTSDMHLREFNNGHNTGAETNLAVGQYLDDESDDTRILIDFDYGSLAQFLADNNLRISEATLKLYQNGIIGTSTTIGQTIDVFEALSSFSEGDGANGGRDGRAAVDGESTWTNQSHPSGGWADGGAHGVADFVASQTLDTVALDDTTVSQWYSFDVTAAFAADGSDLADHAGLVLLSRVDDGNPNAESSALGGQQMLFNSSEAAGNLPIIEFTVTAVPEPSASVLCAIVLATASVTQWRRRRKGTRVRPPVSSGRDRQYS